MSTESINFREISSDSLIIKVSKKPLQDNGNNAYHDKATRLNYLLIAFEVENRTSNNVELDDEHLILYNQSKEKLNADRNDLEKLF